MAREKLFIQNVPTRTSERLADQIKLFSMSILYSLCHRYQKTLSNFELQFAKPHDASAERIRKYAEGERLKREELVTVLSLLCGNAANLSEYARYYPKYQELWRVLICTPSLLGTQVEEILGRRPEIVDNENWNRKYLPEPILMSAPMEFISQRYYWHSNQLALDDIEFYLPNCLRTEFAKYFFTLEEREVQCLEALPDEGFSLTVESHEKDIVRNLLKLVALNAAGSIPNRDDLTPTRVKVPVKKFDSIGYIEELPGGVNEKALMVLAYSCFAYSQRRQNGIFEMDEEELVTKFARFIVNRLAELIEGPMLSVFIPEYLGFNRSWASNPRSKLIFELVKSLIAPVDGWQSLTNLPLRYLLKDRMISDRIAYTTLFSIDDRRRASSLRESSGYRLDESEIDWFRDITWPFVISMLRLMSCAGLIELACEEHPDEDDPMFGLRYLKLTGLGKYALGLTDTYAPKYDVVDDNIEFDDNLIITMQSENSPYVRFLEQIGRRIGPTRYLVTAETFVAGCSTPEEVNAKLRSFRKIICPNPTPAWQAMLDLVEKRSHSYRSATLLFDIVRLDTTVPGLIKFIEECEEIMNNAYRADGGLLLIKKEFKSKFDKLMRKAGFLC